MSTFHVENEFQDAGDSINSIMVINSARQNYDSRQSSFGPSTDISNIEQTSKENDLKALQKNFNDLKIKYDECFKDNVLLKSQCDFLNSKLENLKKATNTEDNLSDYDLDNFENNDSILAYVDVENICISDKIEKTCRETNQAFTGIDAIFDSMQFFVKNIWSLIAHKYSETELEDSQMIKNELIEKLIDSKVEFQRQQKEIRELNDELGSNTVQAELMKEKFVIQNKQLKELVEAIQNKKSNPDTEYMSETEADTSIPKKSPSILSRFKNMVKSSTDQDIINSLDSKEKEIYMFTTNDDFIAVDKTLESSQNTLIRSQGPDELVQSINQAPTTSKINNEHDDSIFKCMNCKTSTEITKISNSKMQKHIFKECREKLVCMFCMELFEKSEQFQFERHVQAHVINV